MLACVDVSYEHGTALAACVLFDAWTADRPLRVLTTRVEPIAPYEPGAFFKRELPCIEAVLSDATELPEVVLVDGYVWLGRDRPGLGAHLFEALGGRVAVVGLAKTAFHGNDVALPVMRGISKLSSSEFARRRAPGSSRAKPRSSWSRSRRASSWSHGLAHRRRHGCLAPPLGRFRALLVLRWSSSPASHLERRTKRDRPERPTRVA